MNFHSTASQRLVSRRTKCPLVSTLLVVVIVPGCFNADAMIEKRRDIAIQTQLQEVDIGKFHVSIPRPSEQVAAAEIHFHVFGHVATRDFKSVEVLLEEHGPELRHRLLLSTRALAIQDLEDPKLTSLRKHIASVVNENLEGSPVQSIGFYQFRFSNL